MQWKRRQVQFLTEWPESCSQLGSEEFRLFPCCEMAAFGESGVVNLLAKEAITALFSLSFHKLPHQFPNLVCVGVKREVSCIEHVNLRARYVFSIPFWLAEIERKIVLFPNNKELGLRLLHPCLPLRISIDVRTVVIEKIALNLCVAWRVQECVLIRPKVRVIEFNIRIVANVPRLCRCQQIRRA